MEFNLLLGLVSVFNVYKYVCVARAYVNNSLHKSLAIVVEEEVHFMYSNVFHMNSIWLNQRIVAEIPSILNIIYISRIYYYGIGISSH